MTESPEPSHKLALEEARRGFDHLAGESDVIRNRAVSTLGIGNRHTQSPDEPNRVQELLFFGRLGL